MLPYITSVNTEKESDGQTVVQKEALPTPDTPLSAAYEAQLKMESKDVAENTDNHRPQEKRGMKFV